MLLSDMVGRVLQSGWTMNDLRRIDGGSDYWVPSPEPRPVTRLREVQPDAPLSRAKGHTPLTYAKLMVADGYSVERVSERTGWGAWWLR